MQEIHLSRTLSCKRRERGLTQEELAAQMGVSKASVSKWETGQSYPDITLLPRLAAFFAISIDELVDYQPQLDKAAIRALYHQLAADFASAPFDDVLLRLREAVRDYAACYPLLVQMALLLINHHSLAPTPTGQQALLAEACGLLQRVREKSGDVWLSREALSLEGLCRLKLGHPEELVALYGDTLHPLSTDTGHLALAYEKLGQMEKARQALQVDLYQHMLFVVDEGSLLLSFYPSDDQRAEAIIARTEALIQAYALPQLHPIVALNFYLSSAAYYAGREDAPRTLKQLERFVDIASHNFFPYTLHGDAFFDLIDPWLEELTLGAAAPRDARLIKEGLLRSLEELPAFAFVRHTPAYRQLVQKLRFHLERA